MPEPRTHYQVTFTARQGVLFFAVALAALAGAYFLGVATGYSGRPGSPENERVAAASPSPTAVASQAEQKPAKRPEPSPKPAPTAAGASPAESRPAPTAPGAIAAREPNAAGEIQFFEDKDREEPTPAPASKKAVTAATPTTAAGGGYWVQVLSTTSEPEAARRRLALASKGYRAAVSPVHGARGPTLYRVRIGPYKSREEASKASDVLVKKEKVRTWIVSPGE